MRADDNVKAIQTMYEAFGRGDVQAILDGLVDDVDWATDTDSAAAPWYGRRGSKDDVARFFVEFGSTVEVDEFTPLDFAAHDDSVFAIVRLRGTARSTGKPLAMNLHHYFTFRDGKVASYRGTEDTAQVVDALEQ